jgi:periplasmic glucans biosynthesis protein
MAAARLMSLRSLLPLAAAFTVAPLLHSAPFDPAGVKDFASLQQAVAGLAQEPYAPPAEPLAPFFDQLKYDDHRQIRFKETAAHFADSGSYRLEFFHPGWTAKKTVGMFDLGAGKTQPIAYDPKLFDWGELKVPSDVKYPSGYAGFRVLAPNDLLGRRFEFLVFMGASYFRSVTTGLGWGLSARGLSINNIGGEPEEFPDFTHFWFTEPKGDTLRFLALLNGPSVVGAYEFTAKPGVTTEMTVKASIYLRKPVKALGISPFSSMYWFGENAHPKPYDFRPEVHDSDGLQVDLADGTHLWRPLDNTPGQLRVSILAADGLKGFGLAKRDRHFPNFEDLEAHYHQRPSVWVEPVEGFEKGSVTLLEIPTGEETWDNIVAYYQPAKMPTSTQPLDFSYKLHWLDQHAPGTQAKCTATRRGFVMDSDDHLYVLDFTAGATAGKPADWVPDVDLKITSGKAKVLDARAMRNSETGGWRAFFKLDVPTETSLLEMQCELMDQKKAVSERWLYQWRR